MTNNKIIKSFCFIIFYGLVQMYFVPSLVAQEQDYYIFFNSCRDEVEVQVSRRLWLYNTSSQSELVSEIYRMNADGSDQTRITNNNFREYGLIAIPGMEKIVFGYVDNSGEIGWVDYNGEGYESLSYDYDSGDMLSGINSDGSKIVFLSFPLYEDREKYKDSEIKILDLETLDVEQLTDNTDDEDFHPAISSNGEILFYQVRENESKILLNIDTGEETEFPKDNYIFSFPQFSPDDQYIAANRSDNFYTTTPDFVVLSVSEQELITEYEGRKSDKCINSHFFSDSSGIVVLCSNEEKGSYFVIIDFENDFKSWEIETPENLYIKSFDLTPDENTIVFTSLQEPYTDNRLEWNVDYFISTIDLDGNNYKQISLDDIGEATVVVAPIFNEKSNECIDSDCYEDEE